jgi:iron complex transport system substrate-binding protein
MLILGVGRTPFTFLPNSWGGDIVTKAGGRLLTGGVTSSSGFERISDEVVVAENPDIIIAVPHANEDDIPSLTEYLRSNPAWSSTKAAQSGRVYISVDNSLLQAGTDIARTIRKVRGAYLKN